MKRGKIKRRAGKRVAGYIRVSDESQVEGHSLDAQRAEIERWCERRGYQLVKIYVEEGKSAHTDRIDRRPQLVALLEDAKFDQFDIVVVHMIDRWARNMRVQSHALQLLGECDVGFASVIEDFDRSTPSGKLMLTTMGAHAEFFSDQLGAHVSKTQRRKAQTGLPVGPIPFGYRALTTGGVPQKQSEEALAVREVYERRASGESTGALANWLNSQGCETRKGGMFTSHAIKDMLNCRFYLGKVQYNYQEYPSQHEAIITEDLYQRVQSRKQHRTIVRTVAGSKGLLQGIIYCGNCGKGIQSDRNSYGARYRERHSHECDTNNSSIMSEGVDRQIQAILISVELRPEWQKEMARRSVADKNGPDPKALKEKSRRLSRAYADGGFTDVEYQARRAEIDASLRLTENVELPTLEAAAQLFEDIPKLWEEATPEERRKLLNPLVERVYVDMECSRIGAIAPSSAFRRLLEGAMGRALSPAATLLSQDETERLKVWSWWRRGRAELYRDTYLRTPSPARDLISVELLAA